MSGGAGRDEHEVVVAFVAGNEDSTDGPGRGQDVLAAKEGDEGGRQPAEDGPGGAGGQTVPHVLAWIASWRRRR